MIQAIVDVSKEFLRPSSITFQLSLIAFGVVLAFVKSTQRLARWYFMAFLVVYAVLSSPACAERLVVWQSDAYQQLERAADARGASVVVILGGGNSTVAARGYVINQVPPFVALRLLEGARLFDLLDKPTIIVSGGITGSNKNARPESEGMRAAIVQLGVPPDHVVLESESRNTYEEAIVIAKMLADRRSQPIVLVTSPTHMSRALNVFRAAGLDPIPSPASYKSEYAFERLRWLPTGGGLMLSDAALYDMIATLYYRFGGGTSRSGSLRTPPSP